MAFSGKRRTSKKTGGSGSAWDEDGGFGGSPSDSWDDSDSSGSTRPPSGDWDESENHGGTGSRGRRRNRRSAFAAGAAPRFDLIMLIQSLIVGALCGVGARYLYNLLVKKLDSRILVIMLVMGAFYFAFALVMFILTVFRRKVGSPGNGLLALLIGTVLMLALSALFEFIYELGDPARSGGPTSYIFVIDDSGSMDQSDEHFERYAAIQTIMQQQEADFPYAVYSFNNELYCLRELARREAQIPDLRDPGKVGGGTQIRTILGELLELLDGNPLLGSAPKVLLLSDGGATDIDLFNSVGPVLKEYHDQGVAISTVGLGEFADKNTLTQIAQGTGGVYMDASDIGQLASAMQEAVETSASRDLLSVRYTPAIDLLLAIERIVFMTLLGCLVGISMIMVLDQRHYHLQLAAAPIKSLLGAILLEVLINRVYMREDIPNLIYFILIALIFVSNIPGRPAFDDGGFTVNGDELDEALSDEKLSERRIGGKR